ncbi:MAG TPA: sulfatase [Verrucomicrobiae bacterium]|nr:sulfatase [Verrucomicrobiae bacterium]
MNLRIGMLGAIVLMGVMTRAAASDGTPNLIILLADNLGYGDIGCFGSRLHRTPNLDRMASDGVRFTHCYSASGVCTPSRAALMTGCYPRRLNMHISDVGHAVLQPVSAKGLNPDEVTIAEVLKGAGYATTCIGKWHLGDQPPFLPTRQGFDSYFGIPYSEDMLPRKGKPWPPLPLMRDGRVVEAGVDCNTLTRRYTEAAIAFIRANRERPFFLYLPHATPGSSGQSFASEGFRGKSANGLWGDAVEELDSSTGEILGELRELGLAKRTVVLFTSDNGAMRRDPPQGSNAPLKGWGYTTDEGGMRIPLIAWGPGIVSGGRVCEELVTLMDVMPTFAKMAGAALPEGRTIDGRDVGPLLRGEAGARSPHEYFFYYQKEQLQAVRDARWKLYLPLKQKLTLGKAVAGTAATPLYDLYADIAEEHDVATGHPDVVRRLSQAADRAREELGDLDREGKGQRPAGRVESPTPRVLK